MTCVKALSRGTGMLVSHSQMSFMWTETAAVRQVCCLQLYCDISCEFASFDNQFWHGIDVVDNRLEKGQNLNCIYLWLVDYFYRCEPSSHLFLPLDIQSETGCVSLHEAFHQWPYH